MPELIPLGAARYGVPYGNKESDTTTYTVLPAPSDKPTDHIFLYTVFRDMHYLCTHKQPVMIRNLLILICSL